MKVGIGPSENVVDCGGGFWFVISAVYEAWGLLRVAGTVFDTGAGTVYPMMLVTGSRHDRAQDVAALAVARAWAAGRFGVAR